MTQRRLDPSPFRRARSLALAFAAGLLGAACGSEEPGTGLGSVLTCSEAAPCPGGFVCFKGTCVTVLAEDGGLADGGGAPVADAVADGATTADVAAAPDAADLAAPADLAADLPAPWDGADAPTGPDVPDVPAADAPAGDIGAADQATVIDAPDLADLDASPDAVSTPDLSEIVDLYADTDTSDTPNFDFFSTEEAFDASPDEGAALDAADDLASDVLASPCQALAEGASCVVDGPCPVPATCKAGACVPEEPTCDDGDPCTADACGVAGCEHSAEPPGTACSAANIPCATGACDDTGGCVLTPKPGYCLIDGTCWDAGAPKPGVACWRCIVPAPQVPGVGSVSAWSPDDGAPCDDGSPCTAPDACAGGGCAGKALGCDDGDACTSDACLPASGCVHSPISGTSCDDGDACTTADTCGAGACLGAPIFCDDMNACTGDGCDKVKGCTHAPLDGPPCDDGSACTKGDACKAGLCKGVGLDCGDNDPCTTDTCDLSSGCGHAPATGPGCDDGSACTDADACVDGKCIGKTINCADTNPCTGDGCDKVKGCTHAPLTGPGCDDGSKCTSGDACAGGTCVGKAISCDDLNVCTVDDCDTALGCLHGWNALDCDDGNACTAGDGCYAGQCVGKPVTCDDANPCTADSCDTGKGCLTPPVADGTTCGSGAKCDGGVCTVAWCGNGKVDAGEACDDGDGGACDGCEGCEARHVLKAGGSGGYLGGAKLGLTNGGTVEAWFRRTAAVTLYIATQNHPGYPSGGQADWGLYVEGTGKAGLFVGAQNTQVSALTGFAVDTSWHHLAAVLDKSAVYVYFDGNLAAAAALQGGINAFNGGTNFDIGSLQDGTSQTTGWSIDEVRVSSVSRYGNAFVPSRRFAYDASTVGLWHLDEGSGTTAADAGGKVPLSGGGVAWSKDDCYGVSPGAAVCGDGARAPFEPCDDGNTASGDGCSATCAAEGAGTSCKDLLAKTPGAQSGPFGIDPDGAGPTAPFPVYCDMSGDGGGWTLVAKTDGASSLWQYDSNLWTDTWGINVGYTALDTIQAKLPSFWTVPFTEVRVGLLTKGSLKWLVLPKAAQSLQALLVTNQPSYTAAGKAAWKALVPDPSLQANCGKEGFNLFGAYGNNPSKEGGRVRIGILGNQEANCVTPDSWIGIGGGYWSWLSAPTWTGNLASFQADAGDRATQSIGYVMVR